MKVYKTIGETSPLVGRIEGVLPIERGQRFAVPKGTTIHRDDKQESYENPRTFHATAHRILNGFSGEDKTVNPCVYWKTGGGFRYADINQLALVASYDKITSARTDRAAPAAAVKEANLQPTAMINPAQPEVAQPEVAQPPPAEVIPEKPKEVHSDPKPLLFKEVRHGQFFIIYPLYTEPRRELWLLQKITNGKENNTIRVADQERLGIPLDQEVLRVGVLNGPLLPYPGRMVQYKGELFKIDAVDSTRIIMIHAVNSYRPKVYLDWSQSVDLEEA